MYIFPVHNLIIFSFSFSALICTGSRSFFLLYFFVVCWQLFFLLPNMIFIFSKFLLWFRWRKFQIICIRSTIGLKAQGNEEKMHSCKMKGDSLLLSPITFYCNYPIIVYSLCVNEFHRFHESYYSLLSPRIYQLQVFKGNIRLIK